MADINFGALDPAKAFSEGAGVTNALLTKFAQVRAGRALNAGNEQGAEATLNNVGDTTGAAALQNQHWSQDERVRKLNTEQQARSAKFTADAADALFRLRQQHKADPDQGVGAVLSGFEQLAPMLTQAGAQPQDLDQFRQNLKQNPDQFLTLMHDNAAKHYMALKGGTGAPETLVNTDTGETIATGSPEGPSMKVVKDADGTEHLIRVDPTPGAATGAPAPQAAATGAPAPPPAPPTGTDAAVTPAQSAAAAATVAQAAPTAQQAPLDGATFFRQFTGPHEGGLNPHDANGSPTNHGFNQAANPDIDVTKLSADDAAKRFAATYFAKSGAANLPPALGAVQADTYFINPGEANKFLQESGGDPQKYMALRSAWMENLIATKPDKFGKYAHAWRTRNADLLNYSQQAGGGAPTAYQASPVANAPTAPSTAGVTELFAGAHNKPLPASAATWTTHRAGPGDTLYDAGTTYQVNSQNGQSRVLQAPPRATRGTDKLSNNEQKTLYDLRKSLNERQNAIGLMDTFVSKTEGPKGVKTGGMMGAPGVATAMGPFNSDVGGMRAIVNQLTPAMRNGLPGAASDKDVAMFRGSTVGFDKTPQANAEIAQRAHMMLNREGDYLAFLEAFAGRHGTLEGSHEIWQAYASANPLYTKDTKGDIHANKYMPWRQAIKIDDSPANSAPRIRTFDPASGKIK